VGAGATRLQLQHSKGSQPSREVNKNRLRGVNARRGGATMQEMASNLAWKRAYLGPRYAVANKSPIGRASLVQKAEDEASGERLLENVHPWAQARWKL
jgi:hypothetical protein